MLDNLGSLHRGAAENEALVGRRGTLGLVRQFLGRAAIHGDRLRLFGEPRVGRTVLLDAAAGAVSVAGTLTAAHRGALNVALGFGEGPPPDQ
ncbi:MAG: hypothetical protein QOD50_909, partial [Actinomycetota bacterium]|nr:hypothetical protein [Actinomycetota bacterium]